MSPPVIYALSLHDALPILHASMHLMNVNTPMLREAGIDRFTDIDGVVKFDDGEPTGELLEFAAMFPVTKYIGNPIRTLDHTPESLNNFAKICRGGGVTTATDLASMINADSIQTLSQVADEPLFPVRIVSAARSEERRGGRESRGGCER